MLEQYNVKFNYLKKDGYWCIGSNEVVNVDIRGKSEKSNHQLARNVIKSRYPDCDIINVSYI